MRTYLVIALTGCLLAGAMMSGGCVSKAEYDKLLAMNRRANDENEQARLAAQELRAEKDRLADELAQTNSALQAKDSEIALLQAAKGDLQRAYDNLLSKYEQLSGRKPMVIPDIALPPALDKQLRELAQSNSEIMEYLPKYGMVKLKSDLTFAKGSDSVSPGAKEALGKLVGIMNGGGAAGYNVYVAGHTDDIPIAKPETKRRHPDNWYLSVHRAVAVQKELTGAGMAPERIGAMGFGEYHPVAPNAPNKKGNPLNRRVEIWIVPPDRLLTLPTTSGS